MRRPLTALVAGAALAASAGPAALAASPAPTGAAHLTGTFVLAGTVTAADNVRGEHKGQGVHRTWSFTPGCATGPCPTVTLVRPRPGGSDRVTLTAQAPGYYVGFSSFDRPLRCGSRIYPHGERVPFRITVRVTTAIVSGGQVIAGRINASYRNRVRYNRTPCVAYLGHDAASYHGHIVLPAAS